jgi:hypothetical protein
MRKGEAGVAAGGIGATRSAAALLYRFVVAAGLGASILFIVVGLQYGLQEYGDGSIFSYAVAVRDAWAFHWHNIAGRLFVYLFCFVPAEAFVAWTGSAHGGIVLYGFLFYAAQLLGLLATYAADRSHGRILFGYACASTACLCPLVFGAPTEMWMAHALFWPALALCHYAPKTITGTATVFITLLALVLTHEGALVFAVFVAATVALRGWRSAAFKRAVAALIAALLIWGVVKLMLPPDAYFASVLTWAELNFISPGNFDNPLGWLLIGALLGYAICYFLFRLWMPKRAALCAGVVGALALAAYWLWFDHALHTQNRYYMRTALLFGTPALGGLAVLYSLRAEDQLKLPIQILPRIMRALASGTVAQAMIGAILLVLLVHTVETAKFASGWTRYKAAVRALATGTASDPALGNPRFVSSNRISADLNRLSWESTTQFLSVLVAPNFAPSRLVIGPPDQYVWLSCRTATANEQAQRAIPVESRRLIRIYACLHR